MDRYLLQDTYKQICKEYEDLGLNWANLSVHFKNTPEETKEFWKRIKAEKLELDEIEKYYNLKRRKVSVPPIEDVFCGDLEQEPFFEDRKLRKVKFLDNSVPK